MPADVGWGILQAAGGGRRAFPRLFAGVVTVCAAMPAKEVNVELLGRGAHWPGAMSRCRFPERVCVLVTGPESWRAFLTEWGSSPQEWPRIPWEDWVVLVCLAGQKPTGGYGVEIERVVVTEDKLTAAVREVSPPRSALVTTVLTSPYHAVRLPRASLPAGPFTFEVVTDGGREYTQVRSRDKDALYVVPLPPGR